MEPRPTEGPRVLGQRVRGRVRVPLGRFRVCDASGVEVARVVGEQPNEFTVHVPDQLERPSYVDEVHRADKGLVQPGDEWMS